ncbi:type II toxin-antitoxin system death-on-curing family toxin [Propioniferax innocua]|uniref:Death-on-curing protein n=1 Tax=Propioniferax innocua TaxID=1753 RepID=A0A542ZBF6_9ACTN|nr:type II toxin-antitoxin system death-on-curing family toxin [Propioniferax innocua]TQL57677.1 death-on-curing protein [Propioniferax innocua]
MTVFLSTEDLLTLVTDLGVGPVRDLGLLESAAHRPTTSLWGQEAYPALELKAAALMDSLVNNHPLVDGNKRLGWLATLVFLDLNGVWIEASDDDAYDLVITVASGQVVLADVADALADWARCDAT